MKSKVVQIEKGRDKGKNFVVTELPLVQADYLITLYAKAAGKAGIDFYGLPPSIGAQGLQFVDTKINASISMEETAEINAILDKCYKILPDNGEAQNVILGTDIVDPQTLKILRDEAIKIHVDFLIQDESQNSSKG